MGYFDKQTPEQIPSLSKGAIEQLFTIEVHQVEREQTHINGYTTNSNVFACTIGKSLKCFEVTILSIDGNYLTLQDEGIYAFAADLGNKRDKIRIFVSHDLEMPREDCDLATLIAVDLSALPIVFVFTAKVTPLELGEHFG